MGPEDCVGVGVAEVGVTVGDGVVVVVVVADDASVMVEEGRVGVGETATCRGIVILTVAVGNWSIFNLLLTRACGGVLFDA